MEPRVVFRTHYQVDEPVFAEMVVRSCTSPIQSAYDEVVAQRLVRLVRSRRKEFNVAAAGYAIDLARGLGVVNDQNVWTDKGQLVTLMFRNRSEVWTDGLDLELRERLVVFGLFLEGDGAAVCYLARHLLSEGKIPTQERDWNSVAKELFLSVYADYLELGGTTAARVALRTELDRIRKRGYAGKSGPHKLFIHLQTLYRLGLVDRVEQGAARVYLTSTDTSRRLQALLSEVPTVLALEDVVREHRWPEVAARVFEIPHKRVILGSDELLSAIAPVYEAVMGTGIPLCPLSTLIEAVQVNRLVTSSELVTHEQIVEGLQEIQRQRGSEMRFHVDRRGAPAFVKLSDQILEEHGRRGRVAGPR